MALRVSIKLPSARQIIAARGLESGGRVEEYVAEQVLALSGPYVPRDTGRLERSGAVRGSAVVWDTPYARRQYYENKGSGGLRGARWAERMWLDRGREIVRGAAQMAGGEAKWQ